MLLSLDTTGLDNVGSLKVPANAEIQGVLTVDNVAAGALSCSRDFTAIAGTNSIATVSYTHLTLPTNREV